MNDLHLFLQSALSADPLALKHLSAGGSPEQFSKHAFAGMMAKLAAMPRTPETEFVVADILLEIFFTQDHEALRALANQFEVGDHGHPAKLAWATLDAFTKEFRRRPSFKELKKAMIDSRKQCPQEDDNKGWTRLWKTSGLSVILGKAKAKRGPSRHGQDTKPKRRTK